MKIHNLDDLKGHIEQAVPATRFFQMPISERDGVDEYLNDLGVSYKFSNTELYGPNAGKYNTTFSYYDPESKNGFSVNFQHRLVPSEPKKQYVRSTGIAASLKRYRL